jgi:hypothetical protein
MQMAASKEFAAAKALEWELAIAASVSGALSDRARNRAIL